MIRQAISCDVCGTEKKQTNHWFVAREVADELRLSGWNSRNRSRAGSKHLCGQTCLHKLVDEFMARSIAARVQPAAVDAAEAAAQPPADTSLTSSVAHAQPDAAARMPTPALPLAPRRPPASETPAALPSSLPLQIDATVAPLPDEAPVYASRNWRAEAWERERVRELRCVERR